MHWTVLLDDAFEEELEAFAVNVRVAILQRARLLAEFGPQLGRPYVDTLSGSRYSNMKELRLESDGGVWRVAFAFDPDRQAILLVAGDKAGKNQKRFYRELIEIADRRYAQWVKDRGKAD